MLYQREINDQLGYHLIHTVSKVNKTIKVLFTI